MPFCFVPLIGEWCITELNRNRFEYCCGPVKVLRMPSDALGCARVPGRMQGIGSSLFAHWVLGYCGDCKVTMTTDRPHHWTVYAKGS